MNEEKEIELRAAFQRKLDQGIKLPEKSELEYRQQAEQEIKKHKDYLRQQLNPLRKRID